MSLQKKTAKGLSWSALEKLANRGLAFGIQILLARLIAPSEFALLALLSIFIMFLSMVADGGFSHALIQKKDVSRKDVSTIFFFNFLLALAMYAIAFVVAPLVSNYYEEPRLTLLFRIQALYIVVDALGKIQNSLLIRNLQFDKLFKISTPAILIGGVVGVVMALQGFEVWSLVGSQMATGVFSVICFWAWSDRNYWPRWEFSFGSLTSMAKFGSGVLGGALVTQVVQNMYGLVIGKAFSFEQLAFYNRGRAFHRMPAAVLSQTLNRVLFPVFSTIQDDGARICGAMRKGMPILGFLLFPCMAFLIVAADHIVVILLTEKWLPCAEYMRLFPIIGMFYPIAAIQLSAIRAKGHSTFEFFINLLKNLIAIGTLIFTIQHGVLAVVIGQVAVSIFSNLIINLPACHYYLGYRVEQQIADFLPYLVCTAVAGLLSMTVHWVPGLQSHWGLVTCKGIVFLVVYLGLCHFSKMNGYQEVASRLGSMVQRTLKSRPHPSPSMEKTD